MFFQTVPGSNPGISRPFIVGLVMLLLFLSMQVSLFCLWFALMPTLLSQTPLVCLPRRAPHCAFWTLKLHAIYLTRRAACRHFAHIDAVQCFDFGLSCGTLPLTWVC